MYAASVSVLAGPPRGAGPLFALHVPGAQVFSPA